MIVEQKTLHHLAGHERLRQGCACIEGSPASQGLNGTGRSESGQGSDLGVFFRSGEKRAGPFEYDAAADRAFGDAILRSRERLSSSARWLVRDRDAAEDLVQESLLRAWAARRQFEPGTNLVAWLRRILRNLFISQRRRAKFTGEVGEVDAERRLAQPETQSGAVELKEVAGLFEQLPALQQEALQMLVLDGLSYEQAADRAGVATGTMKSRVHRAREALKTLVDGDALDSSDGQAVPNGRRSGHVGRRSRNREPARKALVNGGQHLRA